MTSHRTWVRRERVEWFALWIGGCENQDLYFQDWESAMGWATGHAMYRDHEARWCEDCQEYRETCDDICPECGRDT